MESGTEHPTALPRDDGQVVALEDASRRFDGADPPRFVECLRHGSMSVELYRPVDRDEQQPHAQDEVYVVVAGTAMFRHGSTCRTVSPGDLLFVPAGVVHRFERFTPDFAVWVVFYGPVGGEPSHG